MSDHGLPHFEASTLEGAADTLHSRLDLHPTDAFFPTVVHEGSYVELDVKKWKTYAADPVDFGQASPYADPHDFRTVRATPIQLRNARPMSNKEISFFRKYGMIRQTGGVTRTQESRRGELMAEIARETMLPVEERKHIMQCEALRGSVDLNIGGQVVNTPYGLNALTVPGVPWATTGTSDPVVDIYAMKDEFLDHAEVEADTVFFDRRIFAQYFAPSAAWNETMKRNPDMTKAFTGFLGADGDIRNFAVPRQPFVMFDMLWVPVSGSYVNKAGASVRRWPLNQLTVAALSAGDGQRILQWAATMDEYNPTGQPAMRVLSKDDPISHRTEYSLNGVPLIRVKERVQTWQVSV
jgi:hypothetical protein